MTTTAARVEVLTAEVRVLMVGSRQITVSVLEQLDPVGPGQIEPFGRVHRRPHCSDGWSGRSRDCPGDCLDVVGRSRRTGMLVRACVQGWRTEDYGFYRAWSDLPLIVLAGLR